MKKTLLLAALVALMTSGCSKTWTGIKQDTYEIITNTKEVVHEVTAPDTVPVAETSSVAPMQNTVSVTADTHTVQTVEPDTPSMAK